MLGIMNYVEGTCAAGFSSINKTSAWPSLWDRVLGIGRMGLIVTLTLLSLPSLLVLYFQSVCFFNPFSECQNESNFVCISHYFGNNFIIWLNALTLPSAFSKRR